MRQYGWARTTIVVGALVGGVIAGMAAPNATPPPAAEKVKQPVDVELILAVDVSHSMDLDELAIQREGYAQAFVSADFLRAVKSGPNGKVSVAYFEWADTRDQTIVIPWRVIDGRDAANAVAAAVMNAPIRRASRTSISGAIDFAMSLFNESTYRGTRRVIDISGDGPNNSGLPVKVARDAALEKGVVINGLPVMTKPNKEFLDLDKYYEACVIGGNSAFVVTINEQDNFKDAILTKLLLEVAGTTPQRQIVPVAEVVSELHDWRRDLAGALGEIV